MKFDYNKIDPLAKRFAAAYWRGRLESLRTTNHEDHVFEQMIETASDCDFHRWRQEASLALREDDA